VNRTRAGSILLALGGLLIAAGGFLPLRYGEGRWEVHAQTHWGTMKDSLDILWDPGPDSSREWWDVAYDWVKVVGLGYPMAAGLALAAGAFAGRSRAAAWPIFLVHCAAISLLMVGAAALGIHKGVSEEGGFRDSLLLLGLTALLGGLLGLEAAAFRRALRRGPDRAGPPADSVNLPPALFLLAVNVVVLYFLFGHPNWPTLCYLVTSAGAAAAALGMVLRRSNSRPAVAASGEGT
jgi:VIT1/CCC1 family predicted Fe2+/Mn2+ transporter